MNLDKFPEAFRRFEGDVDVGRFRSYNELTMAFRWWAGERWRGTGRQWAALNTEAENLGFNVPDFIRREIRESHGSGNYVSEEKQKAVTWKYETIEVKGSPQNRYRDLKTGRFIKKP
jgi:hypothetical protein